MGGVLARLDGLGQHDPTGHPAGAVVRGRRQHGVVRPGGGRPRRVRGVEKHRAELPDAEFAHRARGGGLPVARAVQQGVQAGPAAQMGGPAVGPRGHRRAPAARGRGHAHDVVVLLRPRAGHGRGAGARRRGVPRGRPAGPARGGEGVGGVRPGGQVRADPVRRHRGLGRVPAGDPPRQGRRPRGHGGPLEHVRPVLPVDGGGVAGHRAAGQPAPRRGRLRRGGRGHRGHQPSELSCRVWGVCYCLGQVPRDWRRLELLRQRLLSGEHVGGRLPHLGARGLLRAAERGPHPEARHHARHFRGGRPALQGAHPLQH
mmetsp:Transcript_62256/g.190178  ORF Transcript_62256/g.190178 Transcript_62256/m.190178 type:complete len:315 (+) Transcript_62256:471-1415(+)